MPGPAISDSRAPARRIWLAGLALVLATLLAHLPALRGGWLWDDDVLVLNDLVRAPGGLAGIWAGAAPQEYVPLTTSLYWLEFRLWGASAAGFHAVLLALHAAAVLALWRLLAAWSRLRAEGAVSAAARAGGLRSGAWWGALLFAVHPLTVASVAWVAETKNVLALLGAALAARAWVGWLAHGSRRALLLALLAFMAALLAKSALVMLPAVLLLLAWWHARGAGGSDARWLGVRRRDVLASAPLLAVSLALGLVTIRMQHARTLGAGLAGAESLGLR
ncbi:MAG TPA: hypothetical protein VK824_09240, partial [Planctomycetota bacterium]|nr:hypothetical protein [Planctomycetota bacterium]